MYRYLLIHSSVDGFGGRVHFLAIMKGAAINIQLQVFMGSYIFILFRYLQRNGIARSYGNLKFNHLRNCQAISRVAVPFTFLSTV